MSTLPSDEVAGDYKEALEDLYTNDRASITNLTMIARENIEYAEAIARVLVNHIKKAPPSRKLPSLYVLDSLVKNVGSPYTVYFGRSLHETFMLAYSQVDQAVRKKLEEMLKTWREPVPGSLSSTPVFPLAHTQTIVDSLNKFRASTAGVSRFQQHPNGQFRPSSVVQGQPMHYRDTSTPPQNGTPLAQPIVHVQQPTPPAQAQHYQPPSHTPVPHTPMNGYQYPLAQPPMHYANQQISLPAPGTPVQHNTIPSQNGVDIGKLHADIDSLTTDAKIVCMTNPMDHEAKKKLTTLQNLKEILESGALSEQDLGDIRNSITQEINKKEAAKQLQASMPPYQPVQQPGYPPQPPYQQPQLYQAPPPAIPSFINTANLAELLRATAAQTSTPPTLPPSHPPPAPTPIPSLPPPPTELPLLAQLRAAGLLSNAVTPPQGTTPPTTFAQLSINDVPFFTQAIKVERPHLVNNFLNAKPNQCNSCGRRFSSDAAGQQKKEKHLDWHFKTKSRQVEAEQRGQNRSWYVDEREWIASKEYDDDEVDVEANGGSGNSPSAHKKKDEDIVRAPSDPVTRNAVCPIDQEPFKSEWSAEIQDFIWRDAIRVGDRYYHASCYRELTKGREGLAVNNQSVRAGTPLGKNHRRTATPDSVLGKRKAEDDVEIPGSASKTRVKQE